MARIASVALVLLWLIPTAYLVVAGLWILAHIQLPSPPYLYLAGLAVAVGLWWFVTKSVMRIVRRLWRSDSQG